MKTNYDGVYPDNEIQKIQKLEARIKELESESTVLKDGCKIYQESIKQLQTLIASARQQAFQEAKQWLDEIFKKGVSSFKYLSYSEGTYYLKFPYDDFTAVQNKIKSELPKE